ncbi:MAG TPA: protease inhibitor I9 family protein [Thermoanaerobaculia bacterium]|nr:protease inhibitor I9 family protein [Thermoanaerobaculia bacterium]
MLTRSLAILTLLASLSANALEVASRDLFIPLAGRTPGANGTFWQTDLVITNHSPEYSTLRVHIDFYPGDGHEQFDVDVPAQSSIVVEDFVQTRLGHDAAIGTLRITSATTDAQLGAHAIVHNTGGTEPLGQTVQALPVSSLRERSRVGGLLAGGGHRSNVGVGNPHDDFVDVTLSTPHGNDMKVRLGPHSALQIDAATLGGDSSSVLIQASRPVYAYGSVIRDGNGDPQFVPPVEVRASSELMLQPACANPAPITFAQDPAPGWIVVLDFSVDATKRVPELMAKYGFTPRFTYTAALKGFAAELTPQQIAALRCEPDMDFVEQDAWATIASRAESLR